MSEKDLMKKQMRRILILTLAAVFVVSLRGVGLPADAVWKERPGH